jgi:parallel beta-helix repeat protein
MKKKLCGLLLILLLFTSLLQLTIAQSQTLPLTSTIYVDGKNTQGPWYGTLPHPYRYIQDAIDNATNNDHIYVFNATYTENLLINKTILLEGEQAHTTILNGSYQPFILKILADSAIIKNFTLQNSGGHLYDAGIHILSSHNHIQNCLFYRTKIGIYLKNTTSNTITNCSFSANAKGIVVHHSTNSTLTQCNFSHNSIGISIEHSHHLSISSLLAHTNGIGLFIRNCSHFQIKDCAYYDNNDNQGGIFLEECTNVSIQNSHITHNGFGVKTRDCTHISIKNTTFYKNTHYAVYIEGQGKKISISSCDFLDNLRFSVYVEHNKLTIMNCNFINSLVGIDAKNSTVTAIQNYWGSFFGPSLFQRPFKERIFTRYKPLRIFPWRFKPIQEAGADWILNYSLFPGEIPTTRYLQIQIPGLDSDNDGCPDWWEIHYGYDAYTWDDHGTLDADEDGLNNIEECYMYEYGADPFVKDIFVEIDWMSSLEENISNKPSKKKIQELIDVFKPYNITLHVDVGNLAGGEEVPYVDNYTFSDLTDFYWEYFLHHDLNNPRKKIFHYCFVSDDGPARGYSFMGWDHLDSFQLSASLLHSTFQQYSRDHVIISGLLHELCHTLGIFVDDHGGVDNLVAAKIFTQEWFRYKNYKSTMNYFYTYSVLDYSDGSHGPGDFDDWGNLDFSFFKNTSFSLLEL